MTAPRARTGKCKLCDGMEFVWVWLGFDWQARECYVLRRPYERRCVCVGGR